MHNNMFLQLGNQTKDPATLENWNSDVRSLPVKKPAVKNVRWSRQRVIYRITVY
jgi:hypothetical protein